MCKSVSLAEFQLVALTTISTHRSNAKNKSIHSILCGIVGDCKVDCRLVTLVEFIASNESLMVVVAVEITNFSEKLAAKDRTPSKLNISISCAAHFSVRSLNVGATSDAFNLMVPHPHSISLFFFLFSPLCLLIYVTILCQLVCYCTSSPPYYIFLRLKKKSASLFLYRTIYENLLQSTSVYLNDLLHVAS